MHNSDEYEYDEYGYIIEKEGDFVIPINNIYKTPPNPHVKFVSKEEFDKILKSSKIIAQMTDPGVVDECFKTKNTRRNILTTLIQGEIL